MAERCETCRFREPDKRPAYANTGECRRFPPQVSIWTGRGGYDEPVPCYEQNWPWVQPDNWCGEHQPKEPSQ